MASHKLLARYAGAVVLILMAGWSSSALADREIDRERFREGWAAAARGDQTTTLDAIQSLNDYPLRPYLEFELLRQRVGRVPEVVMEQFLARHRDWSFADSLTRSWLRSLARQRQYEVLARQAGDSSDPVVQCHLARADLDAGRLNGLADRARDLWLVGGSQVSDCDPLFDWWRRNGNLVPDLAWQRFHLALDAGETAVASYLRRYLDADQKYWADLWLAMNDRPWPTLRQARQWTDHEQARLIVKRGLDRLASDDWERAREGWAMLDSHFSWSVEDKARIARRIALFQAVAMDPDALVAIDALPSDQIDQQMLEWRARAAMAQADWQGVLDSIAAMDLREQGRGRWRYWRGRALAALNRPEALVAYASLAGEANYYGFLAATALGQDLNLCVEELDVDPDIQRRLMRDPRFERALELHHVGLSWHARRTWAGFARRMDQAELHQAALLAAGQGWHDRAISALGNAGTMRAYPWRFPLIEKGQVTAEARRWNVDPALVYGLMRAESAMQSDALSPAGARGLLQLMPATATLVARRNGLTYGSQADLMNPRVNIPLGIAHLAELQDRYNGEWIHVAAAYNAGAGAVDRWLDSRPLNEPDVWLETLPYYETRDYVPRVLAFATIYEWQLGRSPGVLTANVRPGSASPAFSCAP